METSHTYAPRLFSKNGLYAGLILALTLYLLLVRTLRYQRAKTIDSVFGSGKRSLSSVTAQEAHEIMTQLQELEFPYTFNKARTISLLKAGAIPTMSKLFAATGQNNRRNAGKRAIDTEILLRESQSQSTGSERYMKAVARMNYLHARYRKAGKILDDDMLHTLGSNVVEIFRIITNEEWRGLTEVEKCAIGIFHKNLGDDLKIPYTPLPSSANGWVDGVHFATELRDWTLRHEKTAAVNAPTNDQYVRVYVDSSVQKFPKPVITFLRKTLGAELDDTMRTSLGLEAPGMIMMSFLWAVRQLRKLCLKYLSLPRPSFMAVKMVQDDVNPVSGLYNFNHSRPQPWYVAPSKWRTWGPTGLLLRTLGGKAPGSFGGKYHPQGYDLRTIGPKPQEGQGLDEMSSDVELLRSRGLDRCPFSHGLKEHER